MITENDLKQCQMQQAAHLNGGAEWFGYIYRCVQHPRLTRKDSYIRKDRSVTSEWCVDMQPVAHLREAAEKLSVPYPVTPEQVELLKLVPVEFKMLDDRTRFTMLAEFGLVEFKDGECKLTETGADAIKAMYPHCHSHSSCHRNNRCMYVECPHYLTRHSHG